MREERLQFKFRELDWELDPATTKAVAPSPLERGSRQGLGKVISHLVFSANIAKLNIKIFDKLPNEERKFWHPSA